MLLQYGACCYGNNTVETNKTSLDYYIILLGYVIGEIIRIAVVVYFTLHKIILDSVDECIFM